MIIFMATLMLALNGLTLAKLDKSTICQNNNLGDVIRNPEDCSSYIVCESVASIHYCKEGLHFDARRKVCNWPKYADCTLPSKPIYTKSENNDETLKQPSRPKAVEAIPKGYSSFMAIDVMTGEGIDAMFGYDPQYVVCRHFGAYFLPHPLKCRSYILCAYGYMHEHSCGRGTMWNYKKQQCEISVQAECYHKTVEEKNEISSFIIMTTENPLMVCYTPGQTTTDGLTHSTWYPTGSIYNATATGSSSSTTAMSSSTSATPQSSTKSPHSSSTLTTGVTASKTPNLTGFVPLCPNKTQTYEAHPKDCSKYFMCINGIPVLTSCPIGLLWDSKMEYCDLAKNVKCFQ